MNLSNWLGQVTTGLGAAGAAGTAVAAATGQITMTQAATSIAVSAVLAAWPERPAYATAVRDVIARVPALFAAYAAGGAKGLVKPGLQLVEQVADDLTVVPPAPPPAAPQTPLSGG